MDLIDAHTALASGACICRLTGPADVAAGCVSSLRVSSSDRDPLPSGSPPPRANDRINLCTNYSNVLVEFSRSALTISTLTFEAVSVIVGSDRAARSTSDNSSALLRESPPPQRLAAVTCRDLSSSGIAIPEDTCLVVSGSPPADALLMPTSRVESRSS